MYVNNISVYSMMSGTHPTIKRNDNEEISIYMDKLRSKVMYFSYIPKTIDLTKANKLWYIKEDELPFEYDSKSEHSELYFDIDDDLWLRKGKMYQNHRTCINKWKDRITISTDVAKYEKQILQLIKDWGESSRVFKRYCFNKRTGSNVQLLKYYISKQYNVDNDYFAYVFLEGEKVVGFSFITNKALEHKDGKDVYCYTTRKNLTEGYNGLTLFIDIMTLEKHKERLHKNEFIIDFGGGKITSGFSKYKLQNFKLHSKMPVWFYTIKPKKPKDPTLFD